ACAQRRPCPLRSSRRREPRRSRGGGLRVRCGSAGTHRRNRRRGGRTGPVECAVRYPLVPTAAELGAWKDEVSGSFERTPVESSRPEVSVTITDGTVIVAGDAGGHPAESLRALAAAHHLPVLAEPSSPLAQARGVSSTFVPAHARVLGERTELRDAIRTVVVHGKPTLTRPVAALLADETVTARRLPDDIDALALSVTDEAIGSDNGAGSDGADCAASGAAWV